MALLPCKVIAQVAFKVGGDVFHHLMVNNPNHLAKVSPRVQSCNLHQGSHGTNGSVIEWIYTMDGKPQTAKQVLQDKDESNKQISYRMIGGNLMEVYKQMVITIHVETKGGVDVITWTIDYELLSPENPHPMWLLNHFIELTKEIESHIFG